MSTDHHADRRAKISAAIQLTIANARDDWPSAAGPNDIERHVDLLMLEVRERVADAVQAYANRIYCDRDDVLQVADQIRNGSILRLLEDPDVE